MKRKNQVLWVAIVVCMLFVGTRTSAATKEILINRDSSQTTGRDVILFLEAPTGATEMRISNDVTFSDTSWRPYQRTKSWKLTVGRGQKIVYAQYKWSNGITSNIFNDTIQLEVPMGIDGKVEINKNVETTKSRQVTLTIEHSDWIEEMFISNTSDFNQFDARLPATQVPWTLTEGSGEKTVYVQLKNANGDFETYHDTITYKEPVGQIPGGTVLQSDTSQLYYLGFDGQIHPFLHSSVFHSWFDSIAKAKIRVVSSLTLRQYQVGKPVCIRGGTWLVRFQNFSQLYAVEPGCRLFPLRSEVEARIVYGADWKKRLVVLSEFESVSYSTVNRGVQDEAHDIIDRDNDGLDKATEDLYGSSDRLPDSDGDGLSDLEEVAVWFTSPIDNDTDNDGVGDMKQVLDEYLTDSIMSLSEDVYGYPGGLIIKSSADGKYYMNFIDGYTYFLSRKTTDAVFTSNQLDTTFVMSSSPFLSLTVRSGWHVRAASDVLLHPSLITNQGNLYAL
ncbi:MAG: hypothetical protein COU32_03770 [Candidatus Magasanikbacteria bacterium CG10_big_fil_rev_8_21_14_0_10_42_10]|uniref:Uncharacterized protein n=2 Tax=Candidatus Magasanikiibacteriota TaxID=1752731 RepID=A0A2H0TXK6_9BACT|nr:MAG: hypothetical protein COU32_03770 [Candidatus Magasanikbacteria bacterium CG10_big_fil_rev_8_21_14_0_10_42_10]PIZ92940.1 MAG: hypothetical protein COX82_03680 [Candidatus Magasanikbacteria bacterium CG_4_10_14_0_2_um_filter_41_10]